MLVTANTSERSAFSTKLCSTLPVGPVTCKDTRRLHGLAPEDLVQQLRDLPTPLPAGAHASLREPELRRRSIYEELLDWDAASIPPLAAALHDPDVRLRRNAVLALFVLNGGWWQFECGPAKLDISLALPGLVSAFKDSDFYVRAWAAQAIGGLGAGAASAVPALIELLEGDEAPRVSACLALGKIGVAARAALPALRAALDDTDADVRRVAARAIQQIEQK
jgi:HEAT repeat protein